MGKVYVFAAQGCEEIECLTQVDLLRRAGIETVMCAVGGDDVIRGSHGIAFRADMKIEDAVLDDALNERIFEQFRKEFSDSYDFG